MTTTIQRFIAFSLLLRLSAAVTTPSPYKGYIMYRIDVDGLEDVLKILPFKLIPGVDIWTEVNVEDGKVDVMIMPGYVDYFQKYLKAVDLKWEKIITDISEHKPACEPKREAKWESRSGEDRIDLSRDVTSRFLSYSEIVDYFKTLPGFANPRTGKPIVELEVVGGSYEKRDVYMAKISSDHEEGKPIILMEAGTHAREWAGPATMLHVVQQLVENFTMNEDALREVDFYVIPVTNPDGYEYSRNEDRMWRKTRSQSSDCAGVDGNRNYAFHWGEGGTSADECSDLYKGPTPFSEEETINIRNVGIKYRDRLLAYIAVHSYGAFLLFPWGYTRQPPPDWERLKHCAAEGADTMEKYSGNKYTIGSSAAVLYEAAGGSDDWFKGALNVPFTYTLELPGTNFLLPEELIAETGRETFLGLKAMSRCFLSYYRQDNARAMFRFIRYSQV